MPTGIVIIVVASLLFTLYLIKMVMDTKKAERLPDIAKEEFDALKERVRVLERITVEEGNSLAAEIAALEDRSGPPLNDLRSASSREKATDRA